MTAVRMPSVKAVAEVLMAVKGAAGPEGTDVRLQVCADGDWGTHCGDSQYDLDHTGYWGAGWVGPRTNCRELARDLIAQAADHAAQCEEAAE